MNDPAPAVTARCSDLPLNLMVDASTTLSRTVVPAHCRCFSAVVSAGLCPCRAPGSTETSSDLRGHTEQALLIGPPTPSTVAAVVARKPQHHPVSVLVYSTESKGDSRRAQS